MAKRISQATLRKYITQRRKIELLTAAQEKIKNDLMADLKAGAIVAPGVLTARISEMERRSVAWRQVCARELSEEFCERVFNATKPDKHEGVVVETVA